MKVSDLSHTISTNTPVYPGTDKPDIQLVNTLETDGFIEHRVSFHTHTGTHMDAPAHILPQGKKLTNYQLSTFIGKATVLDCSGQESVSCRFLETTLGDATRFDFILFYTGWDKNWGKEAYFTNFPTLKPDCATFLKKYEIKGIGVDTISIDKVEDHNLPVHRAILGEEILVVENLTNLETLISKEFEFYCIPLKIDCFDGNPVRAFAKI